MTKVEEIENIKREIEYNEKKLKKILEGYDGKNLDKKELIKQIKIEINGLQEEMIDLQHEYMEETLEEMKIKLSNLRR